MEEDFSVRVSQNLTVEGESLPRTQIIYYYAAITTGLIITALVRSIYFLLFFAKASQNLHNNIFSKLIVATMRFFNSNPSGRILNRFSKDIGAIDEYLPSVFGDVLEVSIKYWLILIVSWIVEKYSNLIKICAYKTHFRVSIKI